MADRWTLVTPLGDYQLNPSFSAPRLHPGGVDTNAALRRDGRTVYQRSGDGLRTPGPLILRGRVWRDDHDIAAIVDELDQVQEAAATCIEVRRVNDAGTFVYRDLAGGPHPEVTPDGLGGWEVTIELWPGRAEPVVLPSGGTPIIDRLAIDVGSFAVPDQYGYIFVPNADLLVTAVRIVTPGDVAGENEVVRLWRDSDQALLATANVQRISSTGVFTNPVMLGGAVPLVQGQQYRLTMRLASEGNRSIFGAWLSQVYFLTDAITIVGFGCWSADDSFPWGVSGASRVVAGVPDMIVALND